VRQGERELWATASGGVPPMVMLREGESLQAKLSEASQPRYDLFDSFHFPEKVIAPKYQNGLGTSLITPNGLVDQPVQ
jgi:hypothetical protein